MNRRIWFAAAALIVIVAGVSLVALPTTPEWTTASAEALAAFEAGADAQTKVYLTEAFEYYRQAYELDPDFVIAKWRYSMLLRDQNPEEADRLQDELMTQDLTRLTPRERFFIKRWRLNREGRTSEADLLLEEFLSKHPNDPYIVAQKAGTAWARNELEVAERLYQRLVELDPNWVVAYNSLGYITMAQGRFAESEEYFKSYRFIAPDQANPHDSLGELFITVGRYAEAEASLERALEIKPDFWVSYEHLALVKSLTGDPPGGLALVERARAAGAPEDLIDHMACLARYSELERRRAWAKILEAADSSCVDVYRHGRIAVLTHLAACRLGKFETAREIEDAAAGALITVDKAGDRRASELLGASIYHMQGVRMALEGRLDDARERLLAADDRLTYMGADTSISKLVNRLMLSETLLAAGDNARAHQLIQQVIGINASLATDFENSEFRYLGLERG